MKCDKCLNSRGVISENGLHRVCCLSEKDAMDCLMNKRNLAVVLPNIEEEENKNEERA